ncbi:MAG: hypothetical protein Kow0068_10580 [Marinilabiliales bacterium]
MFKKTIIPLFFLILSTLTQAQLVITGLSENPEIRKLYLEKKNHSRIWDVVDTLQLPFFDDFTRTNVYPDTNKWMDHDVFINNSFCENPPNFGVATFDLIAYDGLIYPYATTSGFIADYLTSAPIDLSGYTPADSLYLSFYFQPQGLGGDYPNTGDSLVLEAIVPDTSVSFHLWSSPGMTKKSFKIVNIPLTNPVFFKKGFQFRFYNYASLGDPVYASQRCNGDFWNIDFVYLNSGRSKTDTIPDDVGMLYINDNSHMFLQDYEAVPWSHYKQNTIPFYSILKSTAKSLSDTIIKIDINYQIIDMFNNNMVVNDLIGSENIYPYDFLTLNMPVTSSVFPVNNDDSARFEIKTFCSYASTSDSIFLYNDTIRNYQNFFNYYAYDDGIPEAGIGVYGNNSENGRFCVQYTTYQPDTLVAVQIFFNHTNEYYEKYFILNVWDNDNGKPGDLLYTSETGIEAKYEGINKFVNYPIDTTLIVSDTFYIGWQKVNTIEMMNVGFDFNRDVRSKTFYSLSEYGAWDTSPYSGAPLIRPVFDKNYTTGTKKPTNDNTFFSIGPNPASDYIEIKQNGSSEYIVSLYNLSGQEIYYGSNTRRLNIKNYNKGVYILKIIDNKGNTYSHKIICY